MAAPYCCTDADPCKVLIREMMQVIGHALGGRFSASSLESRQNRVRRPSLTEPCLTRPERAENHLTIFLTRAIARRATMEWKRTNHHG